MAITPEQNEELTAILEALSTERGAMNERSRSFYDEQVKRHEEYGARIFLSPAQFNWLRSIYTEHVGPLDGLQLASNGARRDTLGDDADD